MSEADTTTNHVPRETDPPRRSRRLWALPLLLVLVSVAVGVAVAANTQPSGRSVSCADLPHGPEARECYKRLLMPSSIDDLPTVFAKASSMMTSSEYGMHFAIECHEVMHDVGYATEKEFGPIDLGTAPSEACSIGFQHGVAEYRLAQLSDDDLLNSASTWCNGQDMSICRHLIGHVIMRRALQGSGSVDLDYVVRSCTYPDDASLPERASRLEEFRCLDGAYMEWSLWVMRVDNSALTSSPEDVCIQTRERSLIAFSACVSQVGVLLYGYHPTPNATMQACTESFSQYGPSAVRVCVYSVANAIVSMSEDPIKSAMSLCSGAIKYDCSVGFARSVAANLGDSAVDRVCTEVLPDVQKTCADDARGPFPFEYESRRSATSSLDSVGTQPGPDSQLGT
jgi:hypothetical protein